MTNYRMGYARVSTTAQDLTRQLDALRAEHIEDRYLYVDKKSGRSASARAGLQELLKVVRPGDQIVVYTLDRLGRNLREVLNLVHDLDQRGVYVRSLADPIPVDTADNSAMAQMSRAMLALFAEMERVFANERAAHAREVRRKNGTPVGRKRAHSDKAIEYARLLRSHGASLSDIADKTGIPKSSVHRYLQLAAGAAQE